MDDLPVSKSISSEVFFCCAGKLAQCWEGVKCYLHIYAGLIMACQQRSVLLHYTVIGLPQLTSDVGSGILII